MPTNQKIFSLKKEVNQYFWVLLTYSLLPGIYKVFDNQLFMLGSIPLIFILFKLSKKEVKNYKYDIPFLYLIIYIILQSLFWVFFPTTNKIGLLMGFFMNVIPMSGYYFSKTINVDAFTKAILKIILIHCAIGVILYPIFGIVDRNNPIVQSLTNGVAFGRMASVSGSLGFGNLLMVGFIISIFTDKRYLLPIGFCLILSLQRSAWLGGLFALFLYFVSLVKQMNISKIFIFGISFALIIIIGSVLINYVDIDLNYVISRFQTVKSAASERSGQWVNGMKNFMSYPLGTGIGQVGQFASRYKEAQSIFYKVPDGDYFRILSEYGIFGILFYLYVIVSFILSLFYINLKLKTNLLILSLIGGELIQMIGSNISEFYFTNFIYWIIIGYYFTLLGKNYSLNFKISKNKNDFSLHSHI